ncbi:MAG: glycosyltransferase, partial [Lachnospiraceae bacterium]
MDYFENQYRRILLVSHEMSYTGAPHSLLLMANALRELHYVVDIWTFQTGEFEREFTKNGYEVKVISYPLKYSFELIDNIKKYDLIIANTIFCVSFARLAQKFVKTVLYLREANNLKDIIDSNNLVEEDLLLCKVIVCVSEYAEKSIRRHYPTIKEIKIIHNYVDDVMCNGILNRKVDNSKTNIIVSGTIEPRKGQNIAINAISCLPKDIRNKCILNIIGRKVSWAEDYYEMIQKVDFCNVVFHDEIDNTEDLYQIYKLMDIFVIPSMDESCSLVALEAAMLGKVILMSENVGAKYIVNADCIFECNDYLQLSTKLQDLLINTNKIKKIGLENRKNYERNATKAQYKKEINSYLKKILFYNDIKEHEVKMENNKEIVRVVYITDSNYVMPTIVSITSLIHNKNKRTKLEINVIGVGLSIEEKNKFTSILNKNKSDNCWINIIDKDNMLSDFRIENFHVSPAALYKFFLAEIFPDY